MVELIPILLFVFFYFLVFRDPGTPSDSDHPPQGAASILDIPLQSGLRPAQTGANRWHGSQRRKL